MYLYLKVARKWCGVKGEGRRLTSRGRKYRHPVMFSLLFDNYAFSCLVTSLLKLLYFKLSCGTFEVFCVFYCSDIQIRMNQTWDVHYCILVIAKIKKKKKIICTFSIRFLQCRRGAKNLVISTLLILYA